MKAFILWLPIQNSGRSGPKNVLIQVVIGLPSLRGDLAYTVSNAREVSAATDGASG